MEPRDELPGHVGRRSGEAKQLEQRLPLGLPGPGGALVLLRHRPVDRGQQSGRALRAGQDADGADGVLLCGIVEEPPRPGPPPSEASATSVWAISTTSRAILP